MSLIAALLPNLFSRALGGLFAAALVFIGIQHVALSAERRKADGLAAELAEERASFAAFQAEVKARTEAARAADAAHAAAVEQAQDHISEETLHDLEARLGALRARYDALRLHAGTAAADSGGGGAAAMPGLPDAAGSADGAARKDRLPADGGLAAEDALIASEQALRLKALQDWVQAQAEVERQLPQRHASH